MRSTKVRSRQAGASLNDDGMLNLRLHAGKGAPPGEPVTRSLSKNRPGRQSKRVARTVNDVAETRLRRTNAEYDMPMPARVRVRSAVERCHPAL